MAWLRLDDGFTEHPKLIELRDDRTRWAFLRVLTHCARYRTSGHVSRATLKHLGITTVQISSFEAVGLLDPDEQGDLYVHDWHDFNPKDPTGAERQSRLRNARRNGESNGEVTDAAVTDTGTKSLPRARASARVPVPSQSPLRNNPAAQEANLDADSADGPVPAAAAAADRLAAVGWTDEQIRQASGRPGGWPRALAWLDHAASDPSCREPGALAWTKFLGGGEPPERQATLAAGAQGTRSATAQGHECPHCGVVKAGPAALREHVENVHWELAA